MQDYRQVKGLIKNMSKKGILQGAVMEPISEPVYVYCRYLLERHRTGLTASVDNQPLNATNKKLHFLLLFKTFESKTLKKKVIQKEKLIFYYHVNPKIDLYIQFNPKIIGKENYKGLKWKLHTSTYSSPCPLKTKE